LMCCCQDHSVFGSSLAGLVVGAIKNLENRTVALENGDGSALTPNRILDRITGNPK